MNNPEQFIIYLDIFAFLFLFAFFVILFKSNSLTKDNKKKEDLISTKGHEIF